MIPGLRLALIISAALLGCSAAAVVIGIPRQVKATARANSSRVGPGAGIQRKI
jgi:hypothetical protein